MAKRKDIPVETKIEESGTILVAKNATIYRSGKWNRITQYACNLCSFDVLEDENLMLEHILERHYSQAAAAEVLEAATEPTDGGKKWQTE
jgi:hypothetical protein